MVSSSEAQAALDMVKIGYAVDDPTDERRCLNFRVGFDDHEAAYEALRAIDAYNAFSAERVIAALRAANLDRYSRISVGREGSPVVYLNVWGDVDMPSIEHLLREAAADEVDFDGREVRAWWD
jgi:hypothetical protein